MAEGPAAPGDALATGAFRLWKDHLPAGIIQLNYGDNHRRGGEAGVPWISLFILEKETFPGSIPQPGKGCGPKLRSSGSA